MTTDVTSPSPLTMDHDLRASAARVLSRCDAVALCTSEEGEVTRLSFTPALNQAQELVADWMRAAGMTTRIDALGNIIGRFAGREADPVLLLGSHLDSVPGAGKYDGVLGVLLAIEAVASRDCAGLPYAIEIIGFSDEEGVRFHTPYLGSRAAAGSFEASLLKLRDEDGVSLRHALREFGQDPDSWPLAAYSAQRVLGYFEAHIEQGPVLESIGAPLGVVMAIAGQTRLQVRFSGHSGHAGTLPMPLRRDALAAASEWILVVESEGAKTPGLMATVGYVQVEPNAPNVVPGSVTCTLDARHADDEARRLAVEHLLAAAEGIGERRNISFELLTKAEQPATTMDAELRDVLAQIAAAQGIEAPSIVSGAGHDAVVMAGLAPTSMLFLRTPGGLSHCPEEAVDGLDIAKALEVMRGFFDELARRRSAVSEGISA